MTAVKIIESSRTFAEAKGLTLAMHAQMHIFRIVRMPHVAGTPLPHSYWTAAERLRPAGVVPSSAHVQNKR